MICVGSDIICVYVLYYIYIYIYIYIYRGGLILSNDAALGKKIDSAVFPGLQAHKNTRAGKNTPAMS